MTTLGIPSQIDPDDGTPYKKLYDPRKVLRNAELSMARDLMRRSLI